MTKSIFERYPQLNTLRQPPIRGLLSEEVITREVGSRVDEFESDCRRAEEQIPSVNLNAVFPVALEKGAICLENFLGHWGNLSVEELCKIVLIVRHFQPACILEIGTYNGMTTLQLALNAPKGCTVYTLDLPEGESDTRFPLSAVDAQIVKGFREGFGTTTGSYFKDRSDLNIVQLWGDSATFDYSVIDSPVDLVFIDAAHDYQNKRADSENAFELIAPGGVIVWDNYRDVLNPDVTKYLADLGAHRSLFHLRNTKFVVYWNKEY